VVPTNECFDAEDGPAGNRDDWLIVQNELLLRNGSSQRRQHVEAILGVGPERVVEKTRRPQSLTFRGVHGHIGVANHGVGIRVERRRSGRDTNTHRHVELAIRDEERLAERGFDLLREFEVRLDVGQLGRDDDELVAAEAGQPPAIPTTSRRRVAVSRMRSSPR
jgi:hypothetical protein